MSSASSQAQVWNSVPLAPPDSIFALTARYVADTNPKKINLGVGAYRDDNGKPWVLPVVKKASRKLEESDRDHEYLSITGLPAFTNAAQKLVFGEDSVPVKEKRVISVQTLSGTGANHLAALFMSRFYQFTKDKEIYISNPTWANHNAIISNVGLNPVSYPYYNPKTIGLDFDGFVKSIENMPERSVILLHSCAHNPTGVDPTAEQWETLAELFLRKGHYAFFDSAYQGFATGDLDRDSGSVRLFASKKIPMLVCQSFAKNAGLYNERVGALHVVGASEEEAQRIKSQLSVLQRSEISNPPAYGAHLVTLILTEPELFSEWKRDIVTMSSRIIEMRERLYKKLTELRTPAPAGRSDWGHITSQIGMFSFTGLNKAQCDSLVENYSIYLTANGRISMAGLNTHNLDRFAECVDEVVRGSGSKL
ncbi:Aspartate aminotransferase, cytoplasmic [Naganishia albida]|nr:Aspartate aminotransferase, cytoplasmic [Naganishia albida]